MKPAAAQRARPSAAGPTAVPAAPTLAAEWQRLELLAHLVAESRQGHDIPKPLLNELRAVQDQVDAGRNDGTWQGLAEPSLSALERDILACAVAPEVSAHFGWIFQNLQPGPPQPYPTPALVQELLALDPEASQHLWAALAEGAISHLSPSGGTLRRRGLGF